MQGSKARALSHSGSAVSAIVIMVFASAVIALTSLLAKVLGLGAGDTPVHPLQVSAGRFFFALVAISIVAAWMRPSFQATPWGLHAARSLCGWLGVTCVFAAVARIPLADATAISFLSPLATVLLAALLLRERVGRARWLAVLLAAIGAVVLIQPGTEAFRPAAFFALASALLMGFEAILIKRLSDGEPAIRILLVNNLFGTAIAGAAVLFVWQWPTATQWWLLAFLGIAMAAGQSLFIQAMKRGEASHVIPVFYSTLLFAALYDFVLFGAMPTPVALVGAALILTGVVVLASISAASRHQAEGLHK